MRQNTLYFIIQAFVYVLYLCNAQVSHGVEESSLASVIH